MLDIPDEPELVDEGPWACRAAPLSSPESAPLLPATARVRIRACGAFGDCSAPVDGLTAKVCRKLDVSCTEPLIFGLPDTNGAFEFDVPTGFDGYVSLTSASAPCTSVQLQDGLGSAVCGLLPGCDGVETNPSCQFPMYAPALMFFNPPVTSDSPAPIDVPLLPASALPALVGATGGQFDPATGNLLVTALDCTGAPAAGVTYSIDRGGAQGTMFYVENSILSNGASHTDLTGRGGFIGLSPGFVNVTAFDPEGLRIGSIGVRVAPFTITHSVLTPLH